MKLVNCITEYDNVSDFLKNDRNFFISDDNILIICKHEKTLVLNFGNIDVLKEVEKQIELPNIQIIDFKSETNNQLVFKFDEKFDSDGKERYNPTIYLIRKFPEFNLTISFGSFFSHRANTTLKKIVDLYFYYKGFNLNTIEEDVELSNFFRVNELRKIDDQLSCLYNHQIKIASLFTKESFLSEHSFSTLLALNQNNYYDFIKIILDELKYFENSKVLFNFRVNRISFIFSKGDIYFKNVSLVPPYERPRNPPMFIDLFVFIDGNYLKFLNVLKEKILLAN